MPVVVKQKDQKIALRMPKLGDIVIKDRGEVKENFIIVKEYEKFFLGIGERLGYKETFSKTSFALNELKILRQKEGVG